MLTRTCDPAAAAKVAAAREAGHRSMRLARAARQVEQTHPGPVGVLCARELRAYAEFAYGHDPVLLALAEHILTTDIPGR